MESDELSSTFKCYLTIFGLEDGVAALLDDPDQCRPTVRLAVDDEDRSGSHREAIRPGRLGVNQALDEGDMGPDTGTRRNQ